MEPIRIDNISNYNVEIVNGALLVTPKDTSKDNIKRFKKSLPTRKPAPRTPDPNKCVEKTEEFEHELWLPNGMISRGKVYSIQERKSFPSCMCMKPDQFHQLLSDTDWYRHRKEVNRYRRMCANNRVIQPIKESALVIDSESDEYSMENIIRRMDREELELDLTSQHISFMSGFTDHELRALLRKAYNI